MQKDYILWNSLFYGCVGNTAACRDATLPEELNLDLLPLMWEYDHFKTQHGCSPTHSHPSGQYLTQQ